MKIRVRKDFDLRKQNLQILKENLTSHHRIMKHLTTIEHGYRRGAGKSTLMKRIWQRLKEGSDGSILAAYFFNGRGKNDLEKSPLGMVQSMLYQLLDQSPTLCHIFLPIFIDKQKKHGKDIPWHLGELKSFLLSSLETLGPNQTYLLVDALDECMDDEVQSVVAFLESLAFSAIESGKSPSICLASRHYPQVRMRRADELVVEAQGEHDEDISEYVQHNLTINDGEIEREILRKADHVFLWVKLVVELLNKAYTDGKARAMKRLLRDVPSGLDNLYSKLLSKDRNLDEIRESVLIFQWVLFAKKRLSPVELYFAVLAGTEPDNLAEWNQQKESSDTIRRYITSTSKGLLEVVGFRERDDSDSENTSDSDDSDKISNEQDDPDNSDNVSSEPLVSFVGRNDLVPVYDNEQDCLVPVVQFIHESVKDFLLHAKGLQSLDSSLRRNLVGNSHSSLASCCVSYIRMESLDFLEEKDTPETEDESHAHKLYPFLKYAFENLVLHIEAAQVGGACQQETLRTIQHGASTIQRLRKAEKLFKFGSAWEEEAGLIHVATMRSCVEIVRILLDVLKVEVDTIGGEYGTPLQTAAAYGNTEIIQLCLKHGADVNTISVYYGTALQAAAAEGHKDMAQLLLSHGANIKIVGGYFGTALQAAAAWGNEDIAQFFLDREADVQNISGHYGTALQAAAAEGYKDIAQLLLGHDANINTVSGHFGTALQAAAHWGHDDIVQLCLENGGDVNAKGGMYYTALLGTIVAYWRYKEKAVKIAKRLLEHGAEVNARGGKYGSVLFEARRRHVDQALIDLLLQYGAEELPPLQESSKEERFRRIRKTEI